MRSFLAMTTLVLPFLACPATARAEPVAPPRGAQCDARTAVLDKLASKYGETRRSIGLAANRTVMEVFASDATGTWSMLMTLPTGVSCLVASGDGFEALGDKLPAKGDHV